MIAVFQAASGSAIELEFLMSDMPPYGSKLIGYLEEYVRVPERTHDSRMRLDHVNHRQFVAHSQPFAKKDEHGQWVMPPGVKRVNEQGKAVFLNQREINNYCAEASDNDSVDVSYGTD